MKVFVFIIMALCLVGCGDVGDRAFSISEVAGPTASWLRYEMQDNSIKHFLPFPYDTPRVYLTTATDNRPPYVDTLQLGHELLELPEFDSCYPGTLRSFAIDLRDPTREFFIVHLSGHGLYPENQPPALGMGPDENSPMIPGQKTMMSWRGVAEALDGLGVDLLILDGCYTFGAPMIDALSPTDVRFVLGAMSRISGAALSPARLIKLYAENPYTPEDLCRRVCKDAPLAFSYIQLNP